jgi:formylglycine-generating enzyme required for sulfatase activity/uncharacterized caspase-like protein
MLWAGVIFLLLALMPSHARAEPRIALLIGNKDYKPGVGALTNPLNDTRIVGEALKAIGFEVLKPVQNGRRAEMLIAIHAFAEKLRNAGSDAVGFLYYSGHGIASARENYLIPVDTDEPSTLQLSVHGVKQTEILAILRTEAPNAAHYLILDACRNTLQGARGGKGFVAVGQQSGVLVGFATEPGKTASDTGQGSGPYASALAAELVKPEQSDLIMFHNVRVAVMEKTGGDQVPWTEDGIQRRERVQFGGSGKAAQQLQPSEAAEREWQQYAKDTKDIRLLEAFKEKHKADPVYVRLAETRLEELKEEDKRTAAEHQATLRKKEEEEKRKQAETEARAKVEAERRRVALLREQEDENAVQQQEMERKLAQWDEVWKKKLNEYFAEAAAKPEADRKQGVFKKQLATNVPPEAVCMPGYLMFSVGANEQRCFKPGAGKTEWFKDCPKCPEMVVAPTGSLDFRLRSIDAPFAVGRFAVTFDEWDACVADRACNGLDGEWGRGKQPVINVSWTDAKDYVVWLSHKTGKTYRLLYETEREFVTRAGARTPFWWGSSIGTTQANYNGNYSYNDGSKGEYRAQTVPVDSFEPNAWGLYQVHGNVWEWTEDCSNDSPGYFRDGSPVAGECSKRVVRGGSWSDGPELLLSDYRELRNAWFRSSTLGFRVARTLSP